MKTLVLLRHAKSEDILLAASDFERHLKQKGKEDIQKVASYFKSLNIHPDYVFCSSANRTKETLAEFNSICSLRSEIDYNDNLYHASASEILNEILKVISTHSIIFLVGHNFGISDLAEILSEDSCPELPTSGMVILQFPSIPEPSACKRIHFITPKML